ncbi:MAG: hypothetical protein Q9213_006318 [Squamulea squamosa]
MADFDPSPKFAPFFGMVDDIRMSVLKETYGFTKGVANHATWAGAGAAYGTAKAGIGIAGVGTFRPDLIMKVCGSLLDISDLMEC